MNTGLFVKRLNASFCYHKQDTNTRVCVQIFFYSYSEIGSFRRNAKYPREMHSSAQRKIQFAEITTRRNVTSAVKVSLV